MARRILHIDRLSRSSALWLALGAGLALRAVAASLVQHYVEGKQPPRRCIFPDTEIYWALAQALWRGLPYQVSLWGNPHYALRTPGYPLFLAACQAVFGARLLPASGFNLLVVRLVQAAFGAGCVWLVYRLVKAVWPVQDCKPPRGLCVAVVAALFVAFDPYAIAISVLVLSEALFIPLMLLVLWGMACLWRPAGEAGQSPRMWLLAFLTGVGAGAALLVRPSWALCVPALLFAWVAGSEPEQRGRAIAAALVVCLGAAAVMSPWWLRNAAVFGRFVPTALWEGPSLYDGLNPHATGASDMSFLYEPDIRRLDETQMDDALRSRAWAFARAHTGEAIKLAVVKSARFWSPWPNADVLRSPLVACASALVTLPVYALVLIGAWDRRRDLRALVLLAGPLCYFWVLHMLFVGSIRYRIPGMIPALGLAAAGLARLARSSGVVASMNPDAERGKEAKQ